ncbi:MAG TPA: S16 family serine protease, partial [Candidatus Dormibacteraeota bacterium]|nr:S16 family serine protease [Candidatus Dormibacteraeota bacterium]
TAKLAVAPTTPGSNSARSGPTAFLGVASQSSVTFALPFGVTVDVGSIGGPSAGLALTLGLLDELSNGQLTGGHRVAATGTISIGGAVGDVSGVAQKTLAVRRAGAQVFLVPPQELAAARSEAGSMKVYAVSSLEQALRDLGRLGGHIPPPATSKVAAQAG